MTLLQDVLAVISGGVVGFSLGLIGGGGSILAVPLLLYLVGLHNPHLVIGTTALAVAVNAYMNLIPHWKAGNVKWLPGILFAVPGAIGAFFGSSLGKLVNGKDLLFLFAVLMILVAFLMLRKRSDSGSSQAMDTKAYVKVVLFGFSVGILSGFFGIGGGFLVVPGLVFATGMPILNAIGTSLVSVGTFGLTTSVNYAASGLVAWPVAIEYIVGGIAGGVVGTWAATKLGHRKGVLNYIFAGVIFIVALYMIYMNLGVLGI